MNPEIFQKMTETVSCGIFIARQEFLYVNPAATLISGYSEDELLSMPDWAELLHPDDKEWVVKNGLARLQGEEVQPSYEFRIIHKNGGVRWLDYTADCITYEGAPAILGTAFDITDRKKIEKELRNSEDKFSKTFNSTPALIGIVSQEDGRFIDVNKTFHDTFGYTRDEMVGKTSLELGLWQDYDMRNKLVEEIKKYGSLKGLEIPYVSKSGEVIQLLGSVELININNQACLLEVAQDITDKKRAQAELQQEKVLAQITLQSIGDGVITTDIDGNVEYINPVAEELSGWENEQARGNPVEDVLHLIDEKKRTPIRSPIADCISRGRSIRSRKQPLLINKDTNTEYSIEIITSPIRDQEGKTKGAVLVFHDVTELIGMARQLSYQATHDDMTGLVNRREFEERLEAVLHQAKKHNTSHAMAYLDLDQFKVVNDSCGHAAGDELLKQLGNELQYRMRDDDTLARLGGDEFGMLLTNIQPRQAVRRIEELHKSVGKFRFVWEDKVFEVGSSIGLVSITNKSGTLADVMSAADSACYVAKDSGRNRVHVYQADDKEIEKRQGELQWLQKITRAFEDQRFMLYYQPIKPLSDRGLESGMHYELLLRMLDDNGNPVLPTGFIAAAERYHLIQTIDKWVVSTALKALENKEVTKELNTAVCAINLSGQSFGDETFLNFVIDEIRSSSVDPQRICFEITETAAIANLNYAMKFISSLKELGCKFSLDDFGRGFSSFRYLKDLPVDYLKIDGSFVRDLAHDPIDYAMVEAINQIGHVMGIATIAEHVQTDAALEILNRLGVDFVQGSIIAEPKPITPISVTHLLLDPV